jgi:stearoyl-CoA desaturase (Delta-9 desaturase)
MSFIDRVLFVPSYGWTTETGELVVPSVKRLFREAFSRVNIFKSKTNWISFLSWTMTLCFTPFLVIFLIYYFSWPLFIAIVVYSMMVMGTHGTIWFHRYCTHKAYKFSNPFWRVLTQNLVIKTFPEEIYVVSHHVHHVKSDVPGDPYNPKGGFMYCMLAHINHQRIAKNLDEADYAKVCAFLKHTGIGMNTYQQYKKWGTVASPAYTISLWLINWACWYGLLFLIGGHGLACAIFTAAMMWSMFIPAFNFTGHGKGKTKHVDGIDFDRTNLSINQTRPGLLAGEWHNNHHLYPGSARAGFLPYQIDLAWIYIFLLYKIGAVSSYHDSKKDFMKKYVLERAKK